MYNLGIDVGGTTIKCGIVSGSQVLYKKAVSTPISDVEKALEVTVRLIEDVLTEYGKNLCDITTIGIGLPGTVHNGIVTYANNLGWYNVDFKSLLSEKLGREVYVDNDARCAFFAELCYGSGKGKKNVLEITLGTGVGTAFCVEGIVARGNLSSGGEGGLIYYKDSVWEEWASTRALCKRIELIKGQNTPFGNYLKDKIIDGRTPFIAEKEGVSGAKEVIDEHIRHIANGIVNLVNLLRPELVIIGGGIAKEGDRLIKPISDIVNSESYGGEYNPKVEIVASSISESGIVGATVIDKFI